jgi:AraC-like DNA-binding protein
MPQPGRQGGQSALARCGTRPDNRAAMSTPHALPSTVFTTDQGCGEERFEAWRSSISVVFDVAPLDRDPLESFSASVTASHLGALLVGDLRFGRQQFSRGAPRVARDGVNHYLVQWYRSGGFVGQHDDGVDMQVRVGDITVFDLGRTQRTYASPSHVLSIVVPREIADEAFCSPLADLHGTVLRGHTALGGLLSDYLHSLHRRLPAVTLAEAPAVVQATTQMLAACLRPCRGTLAQAGPQIQGVTLERIQQYIAQHLGAPLSPELLSRTFGVSRSMLYRLFEPLGGVAHYVQQQRLARAFHALANPANRRLRVGEIATRSGFTSEAHFSRAFRTTFGLTPSDVRAMGRGCQAPRRGADGASGQTTAEYADWLRGLRA